jgi:site-specific recombinase XerD
MAFVEDLPDWGEGWLAGEGIAPGTPFLLSPVFEYDVDLNAYFTEELATSAPMTQEASARDLAAFLTFLWRSRGGRSWRDATEDDHRAYLIWRRRDPRGPRVSGTTWDREVATVNKFYWWALNAGYLAAHPIPQRMRRSQRTGRDRNAARACDELRPATYSHDGGSERVAWLPPADYRRWRDIGIRGFGADGLPTEAFRGRWAARNTTYCDLMVRTGLRVSEQSALSVFEVPHGRGLGGFRRFWLPASIAKGRSARWVYVPPSLLPELDAYVEIDRAEVIADAQAAGRYKWRHAWVVEDPREPVAVQRVEGVVHKLNVVEMGAEQRSHTLLDGPAGLEPVAFWLGESGQPLSVPAWKGIFRDANERCERAGVDIECHPHALRHSFAVVTLEQLQRGHIDALAELNPEQRRHYTRIFGDPLDWVRRRLGHKSVTTTLKYLNPRELHQTGAFPQVAC